MMPGGYWASRRLRDGTDPVKARVLELYVKGMYPSEISREMGTITPARVGQILRMFHFSPRERAAERRRSGKAKESLRPLGVDMRCSS